MNKKNWKNIKFDKKQQKNKKSDKDSNDGKDASQPKIQNWRNLSNIGASKKPSMAFVSKAQNPSGKDGLDTTSVGGKQDALNSPSESQRENIKNLIPQTFDDMKVQEIQQLNGEQKAQTESAKSRSDAMLDLN